MKKRMLCWALLSVMLMMTACGGAGSETEASTDTTPDTEIQEVEETIESETEPETEPETKKEMASFTDYQKLTVDEESAMYDATLGAFVVPFSDDNVRYMADEVCSVGISGGGEAYSIIGSIDMTAHPEFENGDYYKGIVVKPDEAIAAGTYKITITFAMYMVNFTCTIA